MYLNPKHPHGVPKVWELDSESGNMRDTHSGLKARCCQDRTRTTRSGRPKEFVERLVRGCCEAIVRVCSDGPARMPQVAQPAKT
jgi:hypothetical protein